MKGVVALGIAVLLGPGVATLSAQGPRLQVGGSAVSLAIRDGPRAPGSWRGPGVEVEATASVWLVAVHGRYRHGVLAQDGVPGTRRVVEGEVLGGFALGRWARMLVGPRIRVHTVPEGRHRAIFWNVQLQATPTLWAGVLGSRIVAWHSLAGDVNEGIRRARMAGGEVAVTVPGARTPVGLALGYRLDAGWFGDGRRETSEAFFATLVVALGR